MQISTLGPGTPGQIGFARRYLQDVVPPARRAPPPPPGRGAHLVAHTSPRPRAAGCRPSRCARPRPRPRELGSPRRFGPRSRPVRRARASSAALARPAARRGRGRSSPRGAWPRRPSPRPFPAAPRRTPRPPRAGVVITGGTKGVGRDGARVPAARRSRVRVRPLADARRRHRRRAARRVRARASAAARATSRTRATWTPSATTPRAPSA